MKIRDYIEYAVVKTLLEATRIMPECMIYGLFKSLAVLAYAVAADRRRTTLNNIRIAFPEMRGGEQRHLALKAYLHIADSLALNNLIMTERVSNERLLRLVEPEGWNEFEKKIDAIQGGVLVISGHMGNWELLSQYTGLRLTRKIHVIARKTNNPLLEERIVLPLRQRFGLKVYYKKNALMHMVKAIKRGDICALLLDQKLKKGFRVDFFGRPAPTGGSPALLQIRFGIPVQPVFLVKTGPSQHRMIVPEPIPWKDNGKPLEEQVAELTRLHQGLLEEVIRAYPEQWLWMHNRWAVRKEDR
jgi:KDO2-lipid IV(A) lauroyltransferase